MKRRRRAVESDIGGNARLLRQGVERLGFRNLVNKAAFGQNVQEKNGERVVTGSNATLEVDPRQAETLILAQRVGQLSLALRSMLDTSRTAELPAPEEPKDDTSLTIVRYGVTTAGKR